MVGPRRLELPPRKRLVPKTSVSTIPPQPQFIFAFMEFKLKNNREYND